MKQPNEQFPPEEQLYLVEDWTQSWDRRTEDGGQEDPWGLRRTQEAPWGFRRTPEASGGPRRPQEDPGGPETPSETAEGSSNTDAGRSREKQLLYHL